MRGGQQPKVQDEFAIAIKQPLGLSSGISGLAGASPPKNR